jgi:hypothetical protein
MSMKARITLLSVMIGAYLVGFGMLAGVVVDRMLFDRQRSAVLRRYGARSAGVALESDGDRESRDEAGDALRGVSPHERRRAASYAAGAG